MPLLRDPPPASVLFTPAELLSYTDWRSLHRLDTNNAKATLPVPTATEYAEFQTWHAEQSSSSLSSSSPLPRGKKCLHRPQPGEFCPPCTLSMHNALIAALYDKWGALGGPWRTGNLATLAAQTKYNDTSRAWHAAKLALVRDVGVWEEICAKAVEEDDEQVWGAKKAVEEYERGITFPGPTTTVCATGTRSLRARSRRSLSFTPDTPPATRHRPQGLWSRGVATHDAKSPNACPSADGWEDTSHFNSWEYTISQCRILLVYYPNASSTLLRYRDLNDFPNRGLDNPAVVRLIALLNAQLLSLPPAEATNTLQYLRKNSDTWLVWVGDGEIAGSEEDEAFNNFEKIGGLLGSQVQGWARRIGDIGDEEWACRNLGKGGVEEEEEETEVDEEEEQDSDDCDEMSLASEEDEVDLEMSDLAHAEDESDSEEAGNLEDHGE
ncbi:hypothetical protein BDU57DRAFT_488872 [Ampelomyces quisqualis]|uniref:Uncharacterized protein n=1 Tax=Ampelomyces quisqualis TaxID=50730 RepID=A0A6A5R2A0_AMPQU|nr:hypothetical protein BDU57DRAFT_488872 [Ampelomyces quisqualis]